MHQGWQEKTYSNSFHKDEIFSGSLGGAAVWHLPLAQGGILETRDRIPHRAPCMEPASPSACLCLSLSLSLSVTIIKKKKDEIIKFTEINFRAMPREKQNAHSEFPSLVWQKRNICHPKNISRVENKQE